MGKLRKLLLGAAAGVGMVSASAASAQVTFTFTDTGGTAVGTEARAGFDIAAAYWSSVLTNNANININIGFQSLAPGVLGSASSQTVGIFVDSTYSLLNATGNSALDAQAVANLRPLIASTSTPGRGAVSAVTSGYVDPVLKTGVDTTTTIFDNDGSSNNTVLDMNRANAKALGLGGVIGAGSDATIRFSSNFNFDFDPRDGISPGHFDFIGVAIHEIGHSLGFVSGVDIYDLVGRPNGPLAAQFEAGAFGSPRIGDFRVMSTLDLFRYSGDGVLDWSVGADSYFSIDGGATQLSGDSRFSTGRFNGDGNQASHWIDNLYAPSMGGCSTVVTSPIGIMNPTSGRCEQGNVTGLDLAAFDAIGWNLGFDVLANPGYNFSTADAYNYYVTNVPEPATWAQLILGFGILGGAARRLRSSKATLATA